MKYDFVFQSQSSQSGSTHTDTPASTGSDKHSKTSQPSNTTSQTPAASQAKPSPSQQQAKPAGGQGSQGKAPGAQGKPAGKAPAWGGAGQSTLAAVVAGSSAKSSPGAGAQNKDSTLQPPPR